MAINDKKADYTPKNLNIPPIGATVTQMRSALTTFNATSYPSKTLDTMSERDMIYACKLHNLAVVGL